MDPARNPGVLDTATWDRATAWSAIQGIADSCWIELKRAVHSHAALHSGLLSALTARGGPTLHGPSLARKGSSFCVLAGLADGQQVFLELGPAASDLLLGAPAETRVLEDGSRLAMHAADASCISRFFRGLKPDAGPRALGPVPRLGIGTRMTTAVWPGIWKAMRTGDFAANAIQNSVRELNLMEDLLAGRPGLKNIAFGFGTIESGYTGSSFEGLWVSGALDALKNGAPSRYGADADHIQVKRGPDGIARALRVAEAARFYSFFTLDVSDILDYESLGASSAAAASDLASRRIPDAQLWKEARAFHQQGRRIGGLDYRPDEATLGRMIGKYWNALDAVEELVARIRDLREGEPFDLELSIDEHPAEVPTFECLTSEVELAFVLLEMERRGVVLTHVAPNFGVEKGTDYRGADGLSGLEARTSALANVSEELGVMPDFHSGDDLGKATRRAMGRATRGRNHFKVSPMTQLIFGEVLSRHNPELFHRWWDDALAYARREAAAGSAFAAECIRRSMGEGGMSSALKPSPHDDVFHHFSFTFPGRRGADGRFLHRQEFYSLSEAFHGEYRDRLCSYLRELAEDLF